MRLHKAVYTRYSARKSVEPRTPNKPGGGGWGGAVPACPALSSASDRKLIDLLLWYAQRPTGSRWPYILRTTTLVYGLNFVVCVGASSSMPKLRGQAFIGSGRYAPSPGLSNLFVACTQPSPASRFPSDVPKESFLLSA